MGLGTFAAGQVASSYRANRRAKARASREFDRKHGGSIALIGMSALVAPFVLPFVLVGELEKPVQKKELKVRTEPEMTMKNPTKAIWLFIGSFISGIVFLGCLEMWQGWLMGVLSVFLFVMMCRQPMVPKTEVDSDYAAELQELVNGAKERIDMIKATQGMPVILGEDKPLSDESLRQQEYRKIAAQIRKVTSA